MLLDIVVAGAARDYEYVASDAELHGYDLFHGRADWHALAKMWRARISIYREVLAALGKLPVYTVIRGVDRQRMACRHPDLVNPHSIVLSHLLERIDEHAKKLGQRALVIADELGQEDQRQYRGDLNIYRQTAPTVTEGTGSPRSSTQGGQRSARYRSERRAVGAHRALLVLEALGHSVQIDRTDPAAGDDEQESPWLDTRCGELGQSIEVALSHVGGAQISTRQAERSNLVVDEGRTLGRAISNSLVLHRRDPTFVARAGQPVDVVDGFVSRDAINLGEGVQAQPRGAKEVGHLPPPEAAAEEQRGQTVRVSGSRHRRLWSGGDSTRDPDGVFEVVARDAELLGNDVERLTRPEQAKSILDPSTATSESGLAEAARRIHHDFRDLVGRQPDQPAVTLIIEFEPLQMGVDDFVEHMLPVAHDHQFTRGARQTWCVGGLRVVEQDLGTSSRVVISGGLR